MIVFNTILKNGTGGRSKVGYLAKISTKKQGYFEYAGVGDSPIGVVYEPVSPNEDCIIITHGDALLFLHRHVYAGQLIRQQANTDNAPNGGCMPYDNEAGAHVVARAINNGRGLVRGLVSFTGAAPDQSFVARAGWEDMRAPATAVNPPGLVGDPDFDTTNGGWLFDASSTEMLFIILQVPHSWAQGTSVRPHLHWEPTNTNTGNVYWRMEYKWTNVNDVEAGSFTTLNVLDAGDGVAYTHQLASFGEISGAGKLISSIFTIKLSRIGGDGTDTYNADALLKEFDIHFQVDSIGSYLLYSK